MNIIHPPKWFRLLMSHCVCKIKTETPTIYLTFDDGPIPEVTPFVLETLRQYQAKATFFCVGENVGKYPDIYQQVLSDNHKVGNHTFNHLKGFKNPNRFYFDNIKKANELITTNLFRPPHGQLSPIQSHFIRKKLDYKVILWDVLSKDYDSRLDKDECVENVLTYANSGSIVVFHDSLKAEKNLRYSLPKVLEYFSNKGFIFDKINL